ncbi:MAG: energy-coupling factor ABC transporter permease [Bacillota bacterium]|uniref:energy-coupling factor ABC transporter permease n=1 Tax=Desulfurispora thermophila TaxID=265470 RepID=UPI000362FD35|nr:energy-coupling factor ABC transporter permease [Desulfurispora thermophila]
MHIPDGFLDVKTWAGAAACSAVALGVAVKKTTAELGERQVPRLAVMAAFIFAAQMVNFPIAGGTSGHLLGGALSSVLLGPWQAMLVLSTVLIIQCFGFLDGGVTALGANILNMAVIGVWVAYLVYRLLVKIMPSDTGRVLAIFLAGLLSVEAAALAASLELALSGTISLPVVLSAMLGWHFLIGIGEGLITVLVVNFLVKMHVFEQSEGIAG